jgi:hypothetical protein
MRVPFLLISTALLIQAEPLTNSNRESLLENLEKLLNSTNALEDARFRVAIDAYRTAMESDAAAMSLFLDCTEKVKYTALLKEPVEFREWKRKESDKLASGPLRLALRYQLRWLVLTLQSASPKFDRAHLLTDAQQCVDSIFSDFEKFVPHKDILSEAAATSVFAQAYSIEIPKENPWPSSPFDLNQFYEQILLPPLRNPQHLQELRATWVKYIIQEGIKYKFTPPKKKVQKKGKDGKDNNQGQEGEDNNHYEPGKSPQYIKYITETQPELEWKMEEDLFRSGDESAAAVRMLAHLQKYSEHPSLKDWSAAFRTLLTAKKPAPAAP